MATDGWNYRKAYFQYFDGRYYSVTISVAKGANGNVVYNIGNMKEEASPKVKGSSAGNGNGPRGFASSDTRIRSPEQKSQEKFSADDTTATPQENDKTALAYFGRTHKWSETGYVLLNGARLDFSYEVRGEGGALVATGTSEHCFMDAQRWVPVNLKRRQPDYHARMMALLDATGGTK